MPSFPADTVSEIDQSSNALTVGAGVVTEVVVGTGGDPPPPAAYVGVGSNGVGLGVAVGIGAGVNAGSGVTDGNGGVEVGEGRLVGPGLGVTVAAGVGDGETETWAGSWEQPTAINIVAVSSNKATNALKILPTLIATPVAT